MQLLENKALTFECSKHERNRLPWPEILDSNLCLTGTPYNKACVTNIFDILWNKLPVA